MLDKTCIVNNFFFQKKLSYVIGNLLIFSCLFQFIQIPNLFINNDTQPYSLIFSVLYIFNLKRVFIHSFIFFIIFLIFLGSMLSTIFIVNFDLNQYLRIFILFISFPLHFVALYNYFLNRGFPSKIILLSCMLWFIYSIFQYFNFDFLEIILNHRGGTAGRGITSFAKEPFLYGLQLSFISWIYLIYKNYSFKDLDTKFLLTINIFSLFFFSGSLYSLLIFFLICISLSSHLEKKALRFFYFVIIFLIIFFIINFFFLKINFLNEYFIKFFNERLLFILSKLLYLDFNILFEDRSFVERFINMSKAYYSFISNYFIPQGVDAVNDMWFDLRENNNIYVNIEPSTRIWSYIGAYLFHLGIFGFIIILVKSYLLFIFQKNLLFVACVLVILFGNIPVGFALTPMIFVASCIDYEKNNIL